MVTQLASTDMIATGRKPLLRSKIEAAETRRNEGAIAERGLRSPNRPVLHPTAFAFHCLRRFIEDRCLVGASALSYATIISLVPLTAIVLVIFSSFPIFSGARDHFLTVLLANFAPEIGETAGWWFQYFATSAAKTTAVGTLVLVVTAILLLATIEDHLQIIWRISRPRAWYKRVFAYWVVMTLGPVLLGVGFSLPGYLDSLAADAGASAVLVVNATTAWLATVAHLVSFLFEASAFTLLYCLIPNCKVRFREGLAGALLAAALMEVLKIAFTFFIARFSSYGTVYGAVAGIPIFLLWMYIFWTVVLFGAEVAAGFGHWRTEEASL
jgi:membrane protein